MNLKRDQHHGIFDDNLEDINIRNFNYNFTLYEGKSQSAMQIRALVSEVKASNEEQSERQVELIQPEGLSSSKKYRVVLEYGEDGYINKIIITEE